MKRVGRLAAAVALASSVAQAEPGLPSVVDVAVPGGGGPVHVSLPPGYCGYPSEVRDRLARFLSDGNVRLLGAAGDCGSIERLMREGRAVVAFSLQLAMLDAETSPATRSKPAAYRRRCYEQFPARQSDFVTDGLRQAVTDADGKLTVGQSSSLGRLDATRDAVFGGALVEFSREPDRVIQVQVTACFSPAEVPILWIFEATFDRNADVDAIVARLKSLLATAEAQVAKTMDLNRGGDRPR